MSAASAWKTSSSPRSVQYTSILCRTLRASFAALSDLSAKHIRTENISARLRRKYSSDFCYLVIVATLTSGPRLILLVKDDYLMFNNCSL